MSEPANTATSWSLRELKGSREDLSDQIQSATFVPDTAKAMLVKMVAEFPHESKLLRVDCHAFMCVSGNGPMQVGGWTISTL